MDKYSVGTFVQKRLANPVVRALGRRRFTARVNAAAVRSLGTDLLTVKVELDP